MSCFEFIREFDLAGIAARLVLAVICGGLIGLERENKRRSAGFRTHILICLGAAITTLTSQYLSESLHMHTDVSRLGAQVIAGIGFIDAGTIIVTRRQRVKGLTTAAGLLTAAVIGLACGAGYAEGALMMLVLVLLIELLLSKLEYKFARKADDVNLFIEYASSDVIESITHILRENNIQLLDLETSKATGAQNGQHYCAVLTLKVSKRQLEDELMSSFTGIKDIISIEEL